MPTDNTFYARYCLEYVAPSGITIADTGFFIVSTSGRWG